jgi:hypothetical protein
MREGVGMAARLFIGNAGDHLTAIGEAPSRPALVAVACFGKGGARLLPLLKRSVLVVDASDAAVKSWQTRPAELGKQPKEVVA